MLYRELRSFAMKKKCFATIVSFLIFSALVILNDFCKADIYTYTDEDGTIHIVDNPRHLPKGIKPTVIKDEKSRRVTNLQAEISKKYPPNNKIEEARNTTVKVETPIGHGSGFFITDDGYILSNKHVVKGPGKEIKKREHDLEIRYAALRRLNEWLNNTEKILEQQKAELTISRAEIESGPQVRDKKYSVMLTNYALKKGQYERNLDKYNKEKRYYEKIKRDVDKISSELEDMKSVKYKKAFKIFLIDGTEIYAYLEELSDSYDLALLKLDGNYKTPFIEPGNVNQMTLGVPVYAIGYPLNLGSSATSGTFSGMKEQIIPNKDNNMFIQTNAQINAGNSGGPLITQNGKAIGINTWKWVAAGVEGIGFAIPIDIAFKEFKDYLK